MNLQITVKDDVRDDISCCVTDWINQAAAWSQARYDFVDFEKDVTISIEKLPEDMSGQWAVWQPQKYPYPIRISELDHVSWKVEAKEKYWLTSSYYHTGPQIAYEVATVSLLTGVTNTLGPDDYRETWDRLWTPQIEQYEYLSENYPKLKSQSSLMAQTRAAIQPRSVQPRRKLSTKIAVACFFFFLLATSDGAK